MLAKYFFSFFFFFHSGCGQGINITHRQICLPLSHSSCVSSINYISSPRSEAECQQARNRSALGAGSDSVPGSWRAGGDVGTSAFVGQPSSPDVLLCCYLTVHFFRFLPADFGSS